VLADGWLARNAAAASQRRELVLEAVGLWLADKRQQPQARLRFWDDSVRAADFQRAAASPIGWTRTNCNCKHDVFHHHFPSDRHRANTPSSRS